MAQIDFSAGYRDATKGATIKALQLRREKAAEEQAAAMAPRQISSPWQGAAQMADVIGGGIREGRAAAQEQAGRQRFAELLTGGLNPDEMGEAVTLDPEIAMKYQEHTWDTEAKKAEQDALNVRELQKHGWDVDAATARVKAERDAATQAQAATAGLQTGQQQFTHQENLDKIEADKQTAIAAAKTDQEKQAAIEEADNRKLRLQSDLESQQPQTDEAKLAADLKAGRISQDAFDAAMARKTYIAPSKPADIMSPGAIKTDQDKAPEINEWKQHGGLDAVKAITQVNKAINILQTKGGTGFMAGLAQENLPPSLATLANPDGTIAQDAMKETVQLSLRPILGAQFTQQEGEALMARAFNVNLSPQENVRRAKLILDQITDIAQNKQAEAEWWDTHGSTMQGYSPKPLNFQALKGMFQEEQKPGEGGAAAAPAAAAPAEDYKEGDVVSSPGQPDLVLRNGQWVPK